MAGSSSGEGDTETGDEGGRETERRGDGESPRISMLFMRAAVIKNIFAAADGKLVRVVQPPPAGNVALTCRTARRRRENSKEGEGRKEEGEEGEGGGEGAAKTATSTSH